MKYAYQGNQPRSAVLNIIENDLLFGTAIQAPEIVIRGTESQGVN